MPQRRRYLAVCVNCRPEGSLRPSCGRQGSLQLYAKLKQLLAERHLASREVRAYSTSCLDLCDEGPAILVEPDHFVYRRVAVSDVVDIVDALAAGTRVERLVMPSATDAGTDGAGSAQAGSNGPPVTADRSPGPSDRRG